MRCQNMLQNDGEIMTYQGDEIDAKVRLTELAFQFLVGQLPVALAEKLHALISSVQVDGKLRASLPL